MALRIRLPLGPPRQPLRSASLDLGADGTVAGELARWLDERELDLSVTGLASYRDYIRAYVRSSSVCRLRSQFLAARPSHRAGCPWR